MVAAKGFYVLPPLAFQAPKTPDKSKVFWFFSSEKNSFPGPGMMASRYALPQSWVLVLNGAK